MLADNCKYWEASDNKLAAAKLLEVFSLQQRPASEKRWRNRIFWFSRNRWRFTHCNFSNLFLALNPNNCSMFEEIDGFVYLSLLFRRL
jgi:hypothetical protein